MESRLINQISDLSGQTIRGYTLKELLGQGQLTEVYRVWKEGEEATHILTVITPPSYLSESARERFLLRFDQEAARLLSLKHPHIFPLEGWGQQAGYPYLLMPDVQGKSLASVLRSYGRCSLAYAAAVLERVAETLEYAHSQGILHLGLSPGRVFLHQDSFIQVAGFGLVRLLERRGIEEVPDDPYNALKTIAGTYFEPPEYLAPEIVQGHIADARADVYALGILLYEMLCGQPPFTGDDYLDVALQHVRRPFPPLHILRPDIPLALELVIHQALKRDPDHRFQRPRDLANACMRVLTRRPFALVSPDENPAGSAVQQGGPLKQPAGNKIETEKDQHGLDQDLLGIWQASKSRTSTHQEPAAHSSDSTYNGEHSREAVPSRPSPPGTHSAVPGNETKPDRSVYLPASYAHQQNTSMVKDGGEAKAAKSAVIPLPQPESKQITALFAALENLPRPTYGGDENEDVLLTDSTTANDPRTLRPSLGHIITDFLPTLPGSSILRRRRRFAQMFPQR